MTARYRTCTDPRCPSIGRCCGAITGSHEGGSTTIIQLQSGQPAQGFIVVHELTDERHCAMQVVQEEDTCQKTRGKLQSN